MNADLPLVRCPSCSTPLGQWTLAPGSSLRIKCRRCGDFYEIHKDEAELTPKQMELIRLSILNDVAVMIRS